MEKFIRELPRVATSVNTLGNLDTREGREALPIIKSMIPWTEKVYDMTDEQLKEYKSAYYDEYHNSEEKIGTGYLISTNSVVIRWLFAVRS